MNNSEQIKKRLSEARDDAEALTEEIDCIHALVVDMVEGVPLHTELHRAMMSVLEDSSVIKNENERLHAIVDKPCGHCAAFGEFVSEVWKISRRQRSFHCQGDGFVDGYRTAEKSIYTQLQDIEMPLWLARQTAGELGS